VSSLLSPRGCRLATWLVVVVGVVPALALQGPTANYDESKVPPYTLPDPLVMADGRRVTTAAMWRTKRRPELLRLFETHVYGRWPGNVETLTVSIRETSADALGGLATRKQITLTFSGAPGGPRLELLSYLPNGVTGKVPVFLGLNFGGNQAVHADPAIALARSWTRNQPDRGYENNRATERSRGSEASRWPIELILSRGYGVVTAYYGDLFPDRADGYEHSVLALTNPLTPDPGASPGTTAARGESVPGAIGAWAWGLSRAVDFLETEPTVDAKRIVVFGHSRLGKAALWAGANDPRFAAVVSNESGCGGAALSKRVFGETVDIITTAFPHWFAPKFETYGARVADLPVDQHELLALIAPRPLYIASAAEDLWADPRGEFLGGLHADPVYRLLGTRGIGVRQMPPVDQPVLGTIAYHVRSGAHDVTEYDWQQYLTFADRYVRQRVRRP
jgi:hypothetical protein